MKRLALVASFCGITITQMMAQNINGEQISCKCLSEVRETCSSPFAISSIPHAASTRELVPVMQS